MEPKSGPLDKVLQRNFLSKRTPRETSFPIAADSVRLQLPGPVQAHMSHPACSRCADGIGHQKDALRPFGPCKESHNTGMHVNSICDDFGNYPVVRQNRANNAWVAMRKLTHRVERVDGIAHSAIGGRCCLLQRRVRMSHGDANPVAGGRVDERLTSGQLWRNRN